MNQVNESFDTASASHRHTAADRLEQQSNMSDGDELKTSSGWGDG